MALSIPVQDFSDGASASFLDSLNTRWHKAALQVFLVIVLFHWAEHIVQAYQAFVLHWPRPMSSGRQSNGSIALALAQTGAVTIDSAWT